MNSNIRELQLQLDEITQQLFEIKNTLHCVYLRFSEGGSYNSDEDALNDLKISEKDLETILKEMSE